MQNIRCPHCGLVIANDGTLSGRVVACPQCTGQFQMPPVPPPVRIASIPVATPAIPPTPVPPPVAAPTAPSMPPAVSHSPRMHQLHSKSVFEQVMDQIRQGIEIIRTGKTSATTSVGEIAAKPGAQLEAWIKKNPLVVGLFLMFFAGTLFLFFLSLMQIVRHDARAELEPARSIVGTQNKPTLDGMARVRNWLTNHPANDPLRDSGILEDSDGVPPPVREARERGDEVWVLNEVDALRLGSPFGVLPGTLYILLEGPEVKSVVHLSSPGHSCPWHLWFVERGREVPDFNDMETISDTVNVKTKFDKPFQVWAKRVCGQKLQEWRGTMDVLWQGKKTADGSIELIQDISIVEPDQTGNWKRTFLIRNGVWHESYRGKSELVYPDGKARPSMTDEKSSGTAALLH